MAALQAKPDDRWNFTIEATILEEDAEYLRRNPPQIKRHKREKTVVCKHWMNGLCKKGEDCGYLHQYDMSKMPECQFFRDYGMCTNEDCVFRHIKQEDKKHDCPWYARGFCRHGPKCNNRHAKKEVCIDFLVGFCPKGDACQLGHPRHEMPQMGDWSERFDSLKDVRDVEKEEMRRKMAQEEATKRAE
jgi:hypothetical protein